MKHKLIWNQTWDDNDNSIWEAAGPYSDGDGGCLGYWRLVHKLVKDDPIWAAEHDADLCGMVDGDEEWPTLDAAKIDIEKLHNEILEESWLGEKFGC